MARKKAEETKAPEVGYVTASFRIRKDILEKLKDYCYTERLTQKQAIEKALSEMLDKIDDAELLKRPEG
jgi:hypothetical protein